jgi:hypothetical protein
MGRAAALAALNGGWYTGGMDEWFCEIAGREIGPLSSHQLKAMAANGQILATDSVRRGAAGHWVPASHVRGLFAAGQTPPPPPAGPPSIFATSGLPPPNVAWPTETPPSPVEPPSPLPPPLPPPVPDVTADDSSPFDIFAEPIGHSAARRTNLAMVARARRKRQQQMLMAGSLIFVLFGVIVAILFLMAGDFSVTDLIGAQDNLKQTDGLDKLPLKPEKAATRKSAASKTPNDNENPTAAASVKTPAKIIVKKPAAAKPLPGESAPPKKPHEAKPGTPEYDFGIEGEGDKPH